MDSERIFMYLKSSRHRGDGIWAFDTRWLRHLHLFVSMRQIARLITHKSSEKSEKESEKNSQEMLTRS